VTAEEREAIERMEWAAERWLAAFTRRDDRARRHAENLIHEAERDSRRAERRRRRAEKRSP
jgi:hypothetical protein